jgi:hypothetical protein
VKFAHTSLQISKRSRECLKNFGSVAGTACDVICFIVGINNRKFLLINTMLVVYNPGKSSLKTGLVIRDKVNVWKYAPSEHSLVGQTGLQL